MNEPRIFTVAQLAEWSRFNEHPATCHHILPGSGGIWLPLTLIAIPIILFAIAILR